MSITPLFTTKDEKGTEKEFAFGSGLHRGGFGKFVAEKSQDYTGTYHPEKTIYTGATVGGVHMGGFHTEEAYMHMQGRDNGKGYVKYKTGFGNEEIRIEEVVLTDELLNEAKKISALAPLLEGDTLRLIQPYTMQHLNTFKANMHNGAYGQVNRININSSRHYPYESISAAVDFLNRALEGAYHPNARVQYADIFAENAKRERKAQVEAYLTLLMVLGAALAVCAIFWLVGEVL